VGLPLPQGFLEMPRQDAQSRHNMKKHRSLQSMLFIGFALSLATVLCAQRVSDIKLLVNGKVINAAVLQVDGRSYVDVETLARITNGSVKVELNQILLTIPGSGQDAATPQNTPGLSKGFASEAVTALAEMKEWKGALVTMVTFGLAVDGTWAQTYHDQVEASIARASVAATTSSDHSALQLLNNQFTHLAKWESDFIAERKALNGAKTVDPNAIQNDPALTKISNCGRFLSTMLVSRTFADNTSCD
jgi:hypothetical protein